MNLEESSKAILLVWKKNTECKLKISTCAERLEVERNSAFIRCGDQKNSEKESLEFQRKHAYATSQYLKKDKREKHS